MAAAGNMDHIEHLPSSDNRIWRGICSLALLSASRRQRSPRVDKLGIPRAAIAHPGSVVFRHLALGEGKGANVYLDLGTGSGFSENEFVGRKLRIGSQVVVSILDRDPRCQMITLDPDTTAADPEVLRRVARGHDGTAGVYGAVLAEGTIRAEDPVEILD